MYKVTLQMTEVFDRVPTGKWGASTLFSFKTSDKRILGVTVPGYPRIEAGMTITGILRKPDDWNTLWGWVDHDTGELVMPSFPVATGVFAILLSLLIPVFVLTSLPLSQAQLGTLIPISIACFSVLIFSVNRTIANWRMKKALLEVVATQCSAYN